MAGESETLLNSGGETDVTETDDTVTDKTDVDTNTDTNSDDASDSQSKSDTDGSAKDDESVTYADFTLPEGMTLDEAASSEATDLFKESGLNQDQAQKFVDLFAAKIQAGATAQAESFSQLMEEWQTSAKTDKEFGGDNFQENLGIAHAALDKFGTPELKEFLEAHGAGNHPEMIRFMVKVGKLTKEDIPTDDGQNIDTGRKKDHASLLYPDLK